MNAKGCSSIPRELFYWITFLSKALPLRSAGTFIELLIGTMLTSTGFVTDAYLAIEAQRHWNSYYKWLQHGRWSWLALARQFTRLVLHLNRQRDVTYLVIDDTLTLRSSKKAPASKIHHQHGNKPNLARYVRGQCWVSLAMLVQRWNGEYTAIPLLSRLMPNAGNSGKLCAANTMIRAVCQLFRREKCVRLLVDSWYMRRVFIEAMLHRGFDVIGQARIDTQLYEPPAPRKKGQRGRTRIYGDKYTRERVAKAQKTVVTLPLYGKQQTLRYYSSIALARFINARQVRAVWCEFLRDDGQWSQPSLILSTDTTMTPSDVLTDYAKRWSIETMFNQLKLAWGLKEAWQQTRQCLSRWVHLTMIGYGLLQLLSCINSPEVAALCRHSPWRTEHPHTPGQLRKGLARILAHVNVRQWWCPTREIFEHPD